MASFAAACRFSTRLTARQLRKDATARGFRTTAACCAAQNFTMPALSPTMTEGNISKWNVKEGDSFSAGDVLLEIETDKASMDVEAQDDGIMAKITQGDGTKGIKVGTRIGIIAESGDDLSSLEMPPEAGPALSPPKEEVSTPKPNTASKLQIQSTTVSKPSTTTASTDSAPRKSSGKPKKQIYPLLPSVEHLIHKHGLDAAAIDEIIPSGPNNRLLKGDVLAYLGTVPAHYPAELSSKIEKLSHLDLSNIKLAPPRPSAKATKPTAPIPEPVIQDLEVAVPISMAAVLDVQKRIKSTLGVHMPLSTFIARAADVANDNLPRSKSYEPSADELFNQVLSLDKINSQKRVRGNFLPQITSLPSTSFASRTSKSSGKRVDIIDILSGKKSPSTPTLSSSNFPGVPADVNVFSVTAPKADEKRAQVFLERVKTVLEVEPGRLVL